MDVEIIQVKPITIKNLWEKLKNFKYLLCTYVYRYVYRNNHCVGIPK